MKLINLKLEKGNNAKYFAIKLHSVQEIEIIEQKSMQNY